MILGTKARYAVMAMVDLAGRAQGKPVTLAELAQSQEITLPYLEQIFARLKQQGLVKSTRGPGGGYMLAKTPEETVIADIVLAVDESLKMTRCESHAHAGCLSGKTRCMTHHLWEGLEKQIYGYLSAVSLADVRSRKVAGVRDQGTDKNASSGLCHLPPVT